MNIADIQEYKNRTREKRPRLITFYSPLYQDADGTPTNFSIRVHLQEGDVFGVLEHVVENGGIGEVAPDGIYRFIPWPCALVEIEDA